MATAKLTVTMDENAIRQLDRWVREGRYPNRSRAAQAALDLLAQRNALPTLEWALDHPRQRSPEEQQEWEQEVRAIDAMLDAGEPEYRGT